MIEQAGGDEFGAVYEQCYEYDEQSRLIRSMATVRGQMGSETLDFDYAEMIYDYGETGLLEHINSMSTNMRDNDSKDELSIRYEYDLYGHLMRMSTESVNGYSGEASEGWVDFYWDGINTWTWVNDEAMVCTYALGANGILELSEAENEETGMSAYSAWNYLSEGKPVEYYYNLAYLGDDVPIAYSYNISYDENGWPNMFESSYDENGICWYISCDAEGYPIQISCDTSDSDVTSSYSCSYIKMVERKEDRLARRYVPSLALQFQLPNWVGNPERNGTMCLLENADLCVKEYGPEQAVLSAMGLLPRSLACSNEMKILQYDREHWTDGMNLSGLPEPNAIDGMGGNNGLSAEVPENEGQIYDIQTRLFSLNLPDEWRDEVDVEVSDADGDYPQVRIYLKGVPEAFLLRLNVVASDEEMLDGDIGASVVERIPLPDGKRIDCVTCYYGSIIRECAVSGEVPYFMNYLTEMQCSEILGLLLGGSYTVEEIMEDASSDSVNSGTYDLQSARLKEMIASSIIINGFV